MLKFTFGNAKLPKHIAIFSLPAGHSCPFAKECYSQANPINGKIIDGKHCRFRCYAASEENFYKNVRKARWHNFSILKKNKNSIRKMMDLVSESIPSEASIVRIHTSGDFFTEKYFLAWLNIAINNPPVLFYAYTKALPFWIKYKKEIPFNFRLVASKGGTHDHLIKKHRLKSTEVVFSIEEAYDKNLEIDHDDSHAYSPNKSSFALLLHGIQPKGSKAALAQYKLRKLGFTGYSKNNKKHITRKISSNPKIFVSVKKITKL